MTENECPICVETLHGSISVGCTVPCGHVFHRKCFETWQIHSPAKRCPCCNTELSCFLEKIHIHLPEPSIVKQQQQQQEQEEEEEKPPSSTQSKELESAVKEHYESGKGQKKKKEEGPEPKESNLSEQTLLQAEEEGKDDKSDPNNTQTKKAEEERELKMKRRAAISMEKAQRAMRLRTNKAAIASINSHPEQLPAESRHDTEYDACDRNGQPAASCRTKPFHKNKKSPPCTSDLSKQAPSACAQEESNSRDGVTSLSRSLQRPSVVKHPYRYMHGKNKGLSVKFSTPQVMSKSSQVFQMVEANYASNNKKKKNKGVTKDVVEDQIPDLADKIMQDIESSYQKSF